MPGHLYEDPPAHNLRDPEGLLSDIPAVGTTLLGLLAGLWLIGERAVKDEDALGLAFGAAACLATGYFWSIWFPLNKKMWTSSYVLVAAGWSLLMFALAYWAVEQRGWGKSGWGKRLLWPWLVFGSNAIVAYIISDLLEGAIGLFRFTAGGHRYDALSYLYDHVFVPIGDPGWRALAYSVFYTIGLFPTGVGALPQEDFRKGIIWPRANSSAEVSRSGERPESRNQLQGKRDTYEIGSRGMGIRSVRKCSRCAGAELQPAGLEGNCRSDGGSEPRYRRGVVAGRAGPAEPGEIRSEQWSAGRCRACCAQTRVVPGSFLARIWPRIFRSPRAAAASPPRNSTS